MLALLLLGVPATTRALALVNDAALALKATDAAPGSCSAISLATPTSGAVAGLIG